MFELFNDVRKLANAGYQLKFKEPLSCHDCGEYHDQDNACATLEYCHEDQDEEEEGENLP